MTFCGEIRKEKDPGAELSVPVSIENDENTGNFDAVLTDCKPRSSTGAISIYVCVRDSSAP